jgi:hypothetical protein
MARFPAFGLGRGCGFFATSAAGGGTGRIGASKSTPADRASFAPS